MPRLPAIENAEDRPKPKKIKARKAKEYAAQQAEEDRYIAAQEAQALRARELPSTKEELLRSQPEQKCSGMAKIRTLDGFAKRDEEGNFILRPCRNRPLPGQDICAFHGGRMTANLEAAEKQLTGMRDQLMSYLLEIASNPYVKPETRLAAQKWALERTGFESRAQVSVALTEWQQMLKEIKESPDEGDPVDGRSA